ncbi:MAG TPA: ATP-binding protein, partial [Roseiarcus sp.]|nr:ATP-binding protein [Roseiarcus sp.]
LGTPLATLALVANEMKRLKPPPGPFADDVALLAQEIGRCRSILGKLASLGEDGAGPLDELTIGQLIEEIVAPHRRPGMAIDIEAGGKPPEPVCRRNPGMLYGLRNIMENAADFAEKEISVRASWSEEAVKIIIADDGPGVAPHILARLGEPYITTRGEESDERGGTGGGLGLGLFIAKTLLERSGAETQIVNGAEPGVGAIATIAWSRASFEQGRRRPQEAVEGRSVVAAK